MNKPTQVTHPMAEQMRTPNSVQIAENKEAVWRGCVYKHDLEVK